MAIISNKYTPKTLPAQQGAKIVTLQNIADFTAMMQNWTDDRLNELPAEQYLDGINTKVVADFNWATMSTDYPGASDPGLDGKTVLVLAIKNEGITNSTTSTSDDKTSYYFVNFEDLVDVYTEDNATQNGVDITVLNNKISAALNLHVASGSEKPNAISIKTDGAYVADLSQDVTDLQTLVGKKADGATVLISTGLCKDIDDINEEIGNKADDSTSTPARGLYKYVDDKMKEVSGKLDYATNQDIGDLFN